MPHVLRVTVVALLLAGCSSSGRGPAPGPEVPPESAFLEGTCRTAAADVRAVGQQIPRLEESGAVEPDVETSLRESQDRLRALAEAAEPQYKPALDDLNEKIGIVRIRGISKTYEPELGALLTKAYEAVLGVCTESTG